MRDPSPARLASESEIDCPAKQPKQRGVTLGSKQRVVRNDSSLDDEKKTENEVKDKHAWRYERLVILASSQSPVVPFYFTYERQLKRVIEREGVGVVMRAITLRPR